MQAKSLLKRSHITRKVNLMKPKSNQSWNYEHATQSVKTDGGNTMRVRARARCPGWHGKHILSVFRKFRQRLKSHAQHNKSLHPVFGTFQYTGLRAVFVQWGLRRESKPPGLLLSPRERILLSFVWCTRAAQLLAKYRKLSFMLSDAILSGQG